MKNILIIRSDRFGEFLCSLPAIKTIKVNYPESKIFLLAQKENIDLVRELNFVDDYWEYSDGLFSGLSGALRLAGRMRQERIKGVVVLNPRKDFHLAALLGCSGLRVGYNRKWGFCLNKKIPDKKAWEIKHEIEYNKDLIKLICSRVDIGSVNLRVDTPESLEFLSREIDLKKKYLVLHPFTSNPAKKLNDLFWNVLQERLASISGMNIVVIGTREEAADYCGPAANLAGKLSLRNLACFLKHHCFCFVGLDSGPMHLASLLNIPAAGLFTISNSRRWAPWSNNVLVEQINNQNDFLSAIARIEKFVAAAKKLIDD